MAVEAHMFGRMPAADRAHLEYHVLVCAKCCGELEETFSYVEAIKSALDGVRGRGPEKNRSPTRETRRTGRSTASGG
jgi:hypothetical protein